jgi:GNAT superfamily N-acetyltransferase
MQNLHISKIQKLELEQCRSLIEASKAEGYDFVERLWNEYESRDNRFNESGAILLGAYLDDNLVAIVGLHIDPYLKQATIGRVRHLYVLPTQRRNKIGREIMLALIEHARQHFEILTLRTLTEHGDKFYKLLGFTDETRFENVSHWLNLKSDT